MEFWIERGVLLTWIDSRRIQSRFIARGVIDGDLNRQTGEWLVVRTDGLVESLTSDLFRKRTYSRSGVRARWVGDSVQVQEKDGRARIYNAGGFLTRTI
jgi:hypothetical protein